MKGKTMNEDLKKLAQIAHEQLDRFEMPKQHRRVALAIIKLSFELGFEEARVRKRYRLGEATRITPANLTHTLDEMVRRRIIAKRRDGEAWFFKFLIDSSRWGYPTALSDEEDRAAQEAMLALVEEAADDEAQQPLAPLDAQARTVKSVVDGKLIARPTEFDDALEAAARESAIDEWEREQARVAQPEEHFKIEKESVVRHTTDTKLCVTQLTPSCASHNLMQVPRRVDFQDEKAVKLCDTQLTIHDHDHDHELIYTTVYHEHDHEHDHEQDHGHGHASHGDEKQPTPDQAEWSDAAQDLLDQIEELIECEGSFGKFETLWRMCIAENSIAVFKAISETRVMQREGRIKRSVGGTLRWNWLLFSGRARKLKKTSRGMAAA